MVTIVKGIGADNFEDEILLQIFDSDNMSELNDMIDGEETITIYQLIRRMKQELGFMKLENELYVNFLSENDPDALMKVTKRKAVRKTTKISFVGLDKSSSISRSKASVMSYRNMSGVSAVSTTSGFPKQEYSLSYLTKIDFAEKHIKEINQRMQTLSMTGRIQLKEFKAKIALQKIEITDLDQCLTNFERNVVQHKEFKKGSAIAIPAERFLTFSFSWINNAQEFMSMLRLKLSTVRTQYFQERAALVVKRDLKGVLMPVDFDKVRIVRDLHGKEIEEILSHLLNVKNLYGRIAFQLSMLKQSIITAEKRLANIKENIILLQKQVKKVEAEIELVEKEIVTSNAQLLRTSKMLEEYEAPSVGEYMRLKNKLAVLEKEEKQLQRQNNLLQFQLNNLRKKMAKTK